MYEAFSHNLEEAGRPLGYLFLEKAFQLSAAVPPMSQVIQDQFWLRLVQSDPTEYIERVDKAQKDAEQKLQEKFTEQEILEEVTRVASEGNAVLRWPLLAEYLEDHPEMVKYLTKISLGDTKLPEDIPANLSQLFQSESARNIMRGKGIGASLTEEVIRRCTYLHTSDSCMRWKDN